MDMSIPESHPGKVRQVLFYPNSTNILIAGHKEILLWDTSRQVILSRNEVPTAEIQRKEEFDALVHPTSGTLEVGSISCYDSTIASSTGSGIMIRTGGANGIPMVKINDRDIFSNHSLHKTISHVKLASSSSLFIFSQKKIVIGYSLLSKACEKALKLTVTPRYVAQSRNAGLFLIHDPWLSGGHFLDATSLSLADIEGITAQALSPGRRPWPVYSAFSEDGSYAVVTERNFIRLHRLRPDRQVENLELACKRLYAVAVCPLQFCGSLSHNHCTADINHFKRYLASGRCLMPKQRNLEHQCLGPQDIVKPGTST
ncbi:hypothetical protein NLJ89_g4488 [Agrocybe chaxingu]|uniref:Uncharacterized protein n=1 Tax=Agrocybe chaxingu TaxID=84603 RepID=A0A9W8MUI5_9AGAR|nr:hypothetical protein NLJ89_g4488 [Agrocybe chaxingu]